MNAAAVAGAVVIGLSLGLTGAGGSILALPVLVHLAGVPPAEAVGVSLLVVGAAALVGAVQRGRAGDFHRRAALTFGVAGMGAAPLGARFTSMVPAQWLMGLFAMLMLGVAVQMLRGGVGHTRVEPECRVGRCLAVGLITGLLTGFLGVGGGFVLVPAMMRFGRLPLATATGTSLAVIAVNALVGGLAHLPSSAPHWPLMLGFGAAAVAGTLTGNRLAGRWSPTRLRRGFALLVLATGVWVLFRSLSG